MGVKDSKGVRDVKEKETVLQKNQFEFLYVIGKGGFGKVWKVFSKKYKKTFAVKEMSKAKIVDKKSEKSIKYERDLLAKIKHPFIVNMQFAFQDFETLYLGMDLLTGGDLRYHVSRQRKFDEEQTKFFVCCILLALDYIHSNSILHRDIKPENLVLDDKGYVRLTDFGIAKIYQKENSSETSGTPGYMAPEVMCAKNHTIAVDYFALGVMAYEFMNGRRPYVGKTRKEIKEMIMSKQVQVKKSEIPDGWSIEAADFINRLLQRKPSERLGLRGAAEVKDHAWIKYYPWKDLYEKKIEPTFMAKPGTDPWDKKYCEAPDKIGSDTKERYEKIIRNESTQEAFANYYYFSMEDADKLIANQLAASIAAKERKTTSSTAGDKQQSSTVRESLSDYTNSNSGSSTTKIRVLEKSSSTTDNRLSKLKKIVVSSSNSSLLRQYKQQSSNLSNNSTNSGNSSTSSLGFSVRQRSSSQVNIGNK